MSAKGHDRGVTERRACLGMPVAGLPVLKEGTAAVIEALQKQGVLLKEERYSHKYPYDWRTKLPTIFRATDQVQPIALST